MRPTAAQKRDERTIALSVEAICADLDTLLEQYAAVLGSKRLGQIRFALDVLERTYASLDHEGDAHA